MIHLFEINGDRLVFDSESGALHIVDLLAYEVLAAYNQAGGVRPTQSAWTQLVDKWGDGANQAADEIDCLIDDGTLFAPPIEVSVEQMYPDGPRVKAMCLHVAHDCNLRCRYCFAGTGDFGTGQRMRMDLETGKKAVEFLIQASGSRHNLDIDFFGGEPLMNWSVVEELTAYCEKRGAEEGKSIRLTITTNATLLDQEKTDFINEHMVNCVLSLDGRPSVQDRMRPDAGGRGSYDRTVERIKDFVRQRKDKEYYVRGTFTRENLDFGEDVLHIASLGVKRLSMEPVVAPPGSGYDIREEDIPAILTEYERLSTEYVRRRTDGNGFVFFHFMMDLDNSPCMYRRLKSCGAGSEYVAVTPDGDIYPCHQFVGQEEFRLGNLDDDPLVLDADLVDRFSGLLVPSKPECASCWAKAFCSGGCAANAFHATGELNSVYEIGCAMQKKRTECALWILAKENGADPDETPDPSMVQ